MTDMKRYHEDPEYRARVLAASAAWRAENPEKARNSSLKNNRKRRDANPNLDREYRAGNPELAATQSREYRARLKAEDPDQYRATLARNAERARASQSRQKAKRTGDE
jgi:hypothetical protein